ncbi:DUF3533 domain-containing protein, partial [Listeria innocua]|nr:DUF3533 domain-containing protein [Listeria innocua]
KNKFLYLPMLVVLLLSAVFASFAIPSTHVKIKDLPIAMVNEDTGEMGKTFFDNITNTKTQKNSSMSIKWSAVSSEKEAVNKMNDEKYYATVVIPKDFSEDIGSLATQNPQKTKVKIIINEGMNKNVAGQLENALSTMFQTVGDELGEQVLQQVGSKSPAIPIEMASSLNNPIEVSTEKINKTGDLANGGVHFFQSVWLGSIMAAMILSFAFAKSKFKNKNEKFISKLIIIIMGGITSFVVGYGTVYLQSAILQADIPNINSLGLFLSFAGFAFLMLIAGVESWIGIASVPIFMIFLFFAAPVLTAIPESLNSFYGGLADWLPMSYMYRGVKSIMYFKGTPANADVIGLTITSVIGMVLILLSVFKKDKKEIANG